jgi:predicted nucleic acid-binding protein
MTAAVDSNIVLDVLAGPTEVAERSAALLERVSKREALIVCSLVWAELAAVRDGEEVDRVLDLLRIKVDWSMGRDVMQHATSAWRLYRQERLKGGPTFICPHCQVNAGEWRCPHCGEALPPPRHLLADFLIGGHAEAHEIALITRDRGIYRRYFSSLTVVQP